MIEWSEATHGTGNTVIDAQHRELFDRANTVVASHSDVEASEREIELTLSFLGAYVVTHFIYEERYMADAGCPGQDENRAGHTRFVEKFGDFKERFRQEGATPGYSHDLCRFLTRWLSNHVEVIDVDNLRQPQINP